MMNTSINRKVSRTALIWFAVVGLMTALVIGAPNVRADQGEAAAPASAVQGQVSVGGVHACGVLASGAVQCWGGNDQGQLGNGTVTASTAPSTVVGITSAVAVAAGNTHTCALITGGTVRCWGQGGNGQLGDGQSGDPGTQLRLTPVTVSGINDATAIAAGGFHTCAIVTNGAVKCWGDDGAGQLGDGTPGDRSLLPTPVSGLTGAVALGAGEFSTCALLASHAVKCWGHNGFGQLGDGTMTDRSTPVSVAGLPDPA